MEGPPPAVTMQYLQYVQDIPNDTVTQHGTHKDDNRAFSSAFSITHADVIIFLSTF